MNFCAPKRVQRHEQKEKLRTLINELEESRALPELRQ